MLAYIDQNENIGISITGANISVSPKILAGKIYRYQLDWTHIKQILQIKINSGTCRNHRMVPRKVVEKSKGYLRPGSALLVCSNISTPGFLTYFTFVFSFSYLFLFSNIMLQAN